MEQLGDPDNKIEFKAFHSEILNYHEELKSEQHSYIDIVVILKLDNGMVQQNYMQIEQDIQDPYEFQVSHLISLKKVKSGTRCSTVIPNSPQKKPKRKFRLFVF